MIYFTSLGSFRQRWYEIFLALHIILQVAGLVFLWFHHHTSRPYVGISLAIFLIDRIVYRMWLKSSTHPATLTILEDDETLLLSANWEISKPPAVFKPKNMKNGWRSNEHIFISVPSLSRKHGIQSHPFTIFSAAPNTTALSESSNITTHAWFSLLIRPQSTPGFTYSLLQHARLNPSIRMRLDGPYGSSHALDMLSASRTAILIAGGSGVAVAYPLLYSLLYPTASLSFSSPSSSSSSSDPESPPSRNQSINVKFLWITHAPEHKLWLPEDKLKELEDWGLDAVIAPPTQLAGRPDVSGILRDWTDARTAVVVSGPDGLVRNVRNCVADMVWEGRDVDVQVEKFGW